MKKSQNGEPPRRRREPYIERRLKRIPRSVTNVRRKRSRIIGEKKGKSDEQILIQVEGVEGKEDDKYSWQEFGVHSIVLGIFYRVGGNKTKEHQEAYIQVEVNMGFRFNEAGR